MYALLAMHSPAFVRRHIAAAGALVLLLAISCTALPVSAASRVSANVATLTIAYPAMPATLDPAIAYDAAGPTVLRGLYDSLVTLDGASATKVIGNLAERWTSNATKTVWTFYLHPGIHFHDGTLVDAAAVKFSIMRLLAVNQAPAFLMGQFLTPDRIHVLSRYTIQFDLLPHSPVYSFLTALTSQWGSWVVSPTTVQRHTVHNDWAQGWLATHEAGSGPYTLASYNPNQDASLVAFPGYWKGWGGHHVSRVIIQFVTEDATRRALVERGDADISLSFTPQDLLAMQHETGLVMGNRYAFLQIFISMTDYGPLASAQARQAMAYAFDYKAFANELLKGFARPAVGPLPAGVAGHDPTLKPHPTDLAKAKALLAAAGITPGAVLTLWYTAGDERAKIMSVVLQGQLAQLNVNLKIEARDAATFSNMTFGNAPAAQRPNFFANGWTPDYNDAIDFLSPLYISKGSSATGGGANAGVYHNATVDHLLAQAASSLDASVRQPLLNRVQQILTYDDPAAIFVADVPENPIYRSNLHGFVINPALNETYDFYSLWKS